MLKEFELLGFPNCVGSMDATHIHWSRCPAGSSNAHTGKEGFPTRAFNVIVTHSEEIIGVTPGHPGARYDKSIVHFDGKMVKVETSQVDI